jgi:hypothetical protein
LTHLRKSPPTPLYKGGKHHFQTRTQSKATMHLPKDTISGKTGDPFKLSLGQELGAKLKAASKTLREIMYGFTIHELDLEIRKERGHIDDLFMLVVFGDLVGLPLLPPYYSVRLLPYIIPNFNNWKRRILRERDLTDQMAADL